MSNDQAFSMKRYLRNQGFRPRGPCRCRPGLGEVVLFVNAFGAVAWHESDGCDKDIPQERWCSCLSGLLTIFHAPGCLLRMAERLQRSRTVTGKFRGAIVEATFAKGKIVYRTTGGGSGKSWQGAHS